MKVYERCSLQRRRLSRGSDDAALEGHDANILNGIQRAKTEKRALSQPFYANPRLHTLTLNKKSD